MASFASTVCARLRDTQGFMLAEQLMAVVIMGFLCIAVSAGLGVCIKIQHDISSEATAQGLMTRAIQEVDDQLEFSSRPNGQTGTFVSSTLHQVVVFSSNPDKGILLTQQGAMGAAKETLLVGERSGVRAVFADGQAPSYNKDTNAWSYTINIIDGSGNIIKTQQVGVKRVGAAPSE